MDFGELLEDSNLNVGGLEANFSYPDAHLNLEQWTYQNLSDDHGMPVSIPTDDAAAVTPMEVGKASQVAAINSERVCYGLVCWHVLKRAYCAY